MSLLADKFIKLEWVSDKLIRYVNPPNDSQVLLLHGMSERSVILQEQIISSQANTESVVGSARTQFANSINLHVPLKRKLLWRWARTVRVDFRNSLLLNIMENWWRYGEGSRQRGWGCRCCLWCSRVSDLRVWVSGFRSSEIVQERNWSDRLYLRVFLTPLDLRNVSFQIFKIYQKSSS